MTANLTTKDIDIGRIHNVSMVASTIHIAGKRDVAVGKGFGLEGEGDCIAAADSVIKLTLPQCT